MTKRKEPNRIKCRKCNYTWIKRTADPRRCPFCFTRLWDTDRKGKAGKKHTIRYIPPVKKSDD